ncbi:hypothetical protein GCM10023089_35990 [Quisquiliibacterium transsilvanicum]
MFAVVNAVSGKATAVRLKSAGLVEMTMAALAVALAAMATRPIAAFFRKLEFTQYLRGRHVPERRRIAPDELASESKKRADLHR